MRTYKQTKQITLRTSFEEVLMLEENLALKSMTSFLFKSGAARDVQRLPAIACRVREVCHD